MIQSRLPKRVPYFEDPAWFDENGVNRYYSNKVETAGENWVFMTEEDYAGDSDVTFPSLQKFCLYFENNVDNRWNRQYIKTEKGRYYDQTTVYDYNVGDRYKGSKISQVFAFSEFCEYLSANKHDDVLKKLLTVEK